jgi:hypothetical protein
VTNEATDLLEYKENGRYVDDFFQKKTQFKVYNEFKRGGCDYDIPEG